MKKFRTDFHNDRYRSEDQLQSQRVYQLNKKESKTITPERNPRGEVRKLPQELHFLPKAEERRSGEKTTKGKGGVIIQIPFLLKGRCKDPESK